MPVVVDRTKMSCMQHQAYLNVVHKFGDFRSSLDASKVIEGKKER